MSHTVKRFVSASVTGLVILIITGTSAFGESLQAQYNRGVALYEKGKFRESVKVFRAYLDESRDSDLSDNSQYWLGECFFALKEFEQAIIEFERVLTFPKSNKREDTLYMLAKCHEELNETAQARHIYLRLLAEYPSGKHVGSATKKLAAMDSPQPTP